MALCSASLALLGGATAASAGTPGTWTRVAGVADPDRGTFDVGLARTPDGVLHVLYTRAESVMHRAVAANAKRVGRSNTVAAFGGAVNRSVALVAGPGGLRAFFAGLQEGGAVDRVLSTSTSVDGRAWTPPAAVSSSSAPYAAGGIAAALGIDDTPVSAWGSAGEGFHVGLDPAAPDGDLPGGSVTGPGVGVDSATGQVVLAWDQLDAGRIATQSISPPGPLARVPASGAAQTLHRVGVTGRIAAPGVYVAYTAGDNEFTGRAAVWRFGAAKGTPVSSGGARHVSIAAAPEGRLWVLWDRDGRIYARRSDRAATAFGRLVSMAAPARTRAVHDLAGEGSRGPLDVLALAERPTGSGEWHARLLPGLSLKPGSARGGAVTLVVSDAGDPVPGAAVRMAGLPAKRTGRRGTVRFELPRGRYRATATGKGYSPSSARVRVR